MIEDLTFLEEDEFTKRDATIWYFARKIRHNNRENPLKGINDFISENLEYSKIGRRLEFRKRTAGEVLVSGYFNGCTDRGLAFLVLARALGIPARYVETFDEEWLKDGKDGIHGHVFTDVNVNGEWHEYEPKHGFIKNNGYILNGKRFIEFGKGLDFSEIYVKDDGIYRPTPIKLQTAKSLEEAADYLRVKQKSK